MKNKLAKSQKLVTARRDALYKILGKRNVRVTGV